jgi:hypothetical protein
MDHGFPHGRFVRAVVSKPMIVADVRRGIHAALLARFTLRPHGLLASCLRRWWNSTLVCVWLIMRLALRFQRVRGARRLTPIRMLIGLILCLQVSDCSVLVPPMAPTTNYFSSSL